MRWLRPRAPTARASLAASVNNNERAGVNRSAGGGSRADATPDVFPDSVQITFNGWKTIDRVVAYTLQDNFGSPVEPTDLMTFNSWGMYRFLRCKVGTARHGWTLW